MEVEGRTADNIKGFRPSNRGGGGRDDEEAPAPAPKPTFAEPSAELQAQAAAAAPGLAAAAAAGPITPKDPCAICLEEFDAEFEEHSGAEIQLLACRHRFHAACVHDLQRKGVASTHVCPICRETLPPNTVDVLVADAETLYVRADRGKLGGAQQKALMAQSEAKLREALGREPDNPRVLNDLAARLRGRGELAEATTLLRRALAVREKKLGRKHEDTLGSVSNLAGVLREQGQYEAAETLFR